MGRAVESMEETTNAWKILVAKLEADITVLSQRTLCKI
jgi:hypothetical protein